MSKSSSWNKDQAEIESNIKEIGDWGTSNMPLQLFYMIPKIMKCAYNHTSEYNQMLLIKHCYKFLQDFKMWCGWFK